MSCYGFVQYENSKLILTCRIKLVSYYLSKGFVIIDRDSQVPKNAPLRVKQCIHAFNIFESDFVMICNTAIYSVSNNLNNMYTSATTLNEYISTYYYDKNDYFEMLF